MRCGLSAQYETTDTGRASSNNAVQEEDFTERERTVIFVAE
jgi:hypothetical protein